MYPNVGAAGCGLVGAGGVLGLCPRGSGFRACCMNSYSTIRIKQCYKFVLYNLYNNCIQKLVKKRFASRLGFQPGTKMACNCRSAIHHPTSYISAHFIYIPYNKNTIRKSGLYDLTRMAYSQSLVNIRAHHATHTTLPILTETKKIRCRRTVLSPTRYFAEIE